MPKVELIYDRNCPNVGQARARLLRAFTQAGIPARWREWCRDDPSAPAYVQTCGSPTLFIDGRDIEPGQPAGSSCRLYPRPGGGYGPVPALESLIERLRDPAAGMRFDWRAGGVWGPAVAIAFLPKLVCPACWPAYAAAVSSLGLSFLLQWQYLMPITMVALTLVLGLLAWQSSARHGYGPFWLGLASTPVIVVGKFVQQNNMVAYLGAGLLLVACLWNSWPARGRQTANCVDCNPPTPEQAGGCNDKSETTG